METQVDLHTLIQAAGDAIIVADPWALRARSAGRQALEADLVRLRSLAAEPGVGYRLKMDGETRVSPASCPVGGHGHRVTMPCHMV
jgi:hypothetical protein